MVPILFDCTRYELQPSLGTANISEICQYVTKNKPHAISSQETVLKFLVFVPTTVWFRVIEATVFGPLLCRLVLATGGGSFFIFVFAEALILRNLRTVDLKWPQFISISLNLLLIYLVFEHLKLPSCFSGHVSTAVSHGSLTVVFLTLTRSGGPAQRGPEASFAPKTRGMTNCQWITCGLT